MREKKFSDFLRIYPTIKSLNVVQNYVSHCRVMESMLKDLDAIAGDYAKENVALEKAKEKSNRYCRALKLYFDFAHKNPCVCATCWEPMSQHFYRLSDDMPPDDYFDIMPAMEGEYECILGFGRDEVFRKACEERIERIPVILSPEIKKKTYKTDEYDIAKEICELAQNKHGNIHEQEILAILKKLKSVTSNILGEFIKAEKPYIILYYNAIGGNTPEEKIAGLAKTLAHEYMHYMEHIYCLSKGVVSSKNKKLSEAMADFFGVLYILKYKYYAAREKETIAKERYDAWNQYFGTSWPYAEALHFYDVDGIAIGFSTDYSVYVKHGSVEKLCDVFKVSYDPDVAYNILSEE